ncbi:MAG: gamma-glutamyltransferase [Pseudomonadota bacterium]
MPKKSNGAIACGHPQTAQAAAEILSDGGTAFDAVLAAFAAACVVEPVLASLGGGGYLLTYPLHGAPVVYDFFVQTPSRRPGSVAEVEASDFYAIDANFGTATQQFHIGLGAMATPGSVKGLFRVHEDLAGMPMARLLEPAIRMAKEGWTLRPQDAFLLKVIEPILLATSQSRALFVHDNGKLRTAGERMTYPAMADSLEALACEGEALFYRGDMAQELARLCRDGGGWLGLDDLASYQVHLRQPLIREHRGARLMTNPPPSAGGILVALTLALLGEIDLADRPPLDALDVLAQAMCLTNQARRQVEDSSHEDKSPKTGFRLLDTALLQSYQASMRQHPLSPRGTTHISIADSAGNMAALSLSNGEGCGHLMGSSGIILNNMLGEEDLNPAGFHNWPADTRMASMMAPTMGFLPNGTAVALGSGGSNRIRSAILQVLLRLIHFGDNIDQATAWPRLHIERNGTANLEKGLPDGAGDRLAPRVETIVQWPANNMFFGGVHGVTRDSHGNVAAAGDPRRGGAALVV